MIPKVMTNIKGCLMMNNYTNLSSIGELKFFSIVEIVTRIGFLITGIERDTKVTSEPPECFYTAAFTGTTGIIWILTTAFVVDNE